MRVTEGMMADKYLYSEKKIVEKKNKVEIQIANNSRIQTVSDDVAGSLTSIDINSQMKRTESYLNNVENANGFVQSSLNSLDQMVNSIQSILSVSNSAQNALNNENFATMAQNIKDSLSSIVGSVNEKHNGMYLFGGTNFSNDIVTIDADGKAVISSEDFTGEMKVKISNTFSETMNVPGNKITTTGIFTAINNIITSLSSNSAPTEAQVSALNTAYNKLVNVQSLAGEKITRLDNVKTVLTNQKSNFEQMLSDIQGIDVAKLATELEEQDYLLQVTLKLLSKSTSTSVLDYL